MVNLVAAIWVLCKHPTSFALKEEKQTSGNNMIKPQNVRVVLLVLLLLSTTASQQLGDF